jgi:hypothetical protein
VTAEIARASAARSSPKVETDLHVVQAHAGGDGDPVPLVEAVEGHLVAAVVEDLARELGVLALELLDGQDIRVRAVEPGADPLSPGSDRVHIPVHDAHEVNGSRYGRRMRVVHVSERE